MSKSDVKLDGSREHHQVQCDENCRTEIKTESFHESGVTWTRFESESANLSEIYRR